MPITSRPLIPHPKTGLIHCRVVVEILKPAVREDETASAYWAMRRRDGGVLRFRVKDEPDLARVLEELKNFMIARTDFVFEEPPKRKPWRKKKDGTKRGNSGG